MLICIKKRLSNPIKPLHIKNGTSRNMKEGWGKINKNGDRSQRALSLVLAMSLLLIRTLLEPSCHLDTESMYLLLLLVWKMQKSDLQFTVCANAVCTKWYSMWEHCLHTGHCSCLEQSDFISHSSFSAWNVLLDRLVASGLILLATRRIVNVAS